MNNQNNRQDTDAFLGRGWGFPPLIKDGKVEMVAYEQDIEQSLCILLSTSPGERVNRYDYGCPLRRYAFEPITAEVVVRMRDDISRSILLFEPRIVLEECFSTYDKEKVLYTIERLDLDLGGIPEEYFYREFPRRLKDELQKALS